MKLRSFTPREMDDLRRYYRRAYRLNLSGVWNDDEYEQGYANGVISFMAYLFGEVADLPDLPELPQPTRDDIVGSITQEPK